MKITNMKITMSRAFSTIAIVAAIGAGSSCQTVKLPSSDALSFPQFGEDREGEPQYPNVAEAPKNPGNMRLKNDWDEAARRLMQVRADFVVPDTPDAPLSDAEIASEIKSLQQKAQAYKADDPQ